jgi:glucosamine kinase
MKSILLAESGSTKTDWCLLKKDDVKYVHLQTNGINPHLQSPEQIGELLSTELKWDTENYKPEAIYFYGAGASLPEKQQIIKNALQRFFNTDAIDVQCDMLAAARSLCGNKKGIVSILGTGSNSCYYNGSQIEERQRSLGYIAGDEGSGNHMGKKVLQYYAYKTFDEELTIAFEQLFGNDIPLMLHKLYKEPFPNRYLAGFVTLLKQNRGHFMVENIVEDCLNDFFHACLMKYRQSWKQPLYFTGSVAFEFSDVIHGLCDQYEMECGDIVKSPVAGLLKYHTSQM